MTLETKYGIASVFSFLAAMATLGHVVALAYGVL